MFKTAMISIMNATSCSLCATSRRVLNLLSYLALNSATAGEKGELCSPQTADKEGKSVVFPSLWLSAENQ